MNYFEPAQIQDQIALAMEKISTSAPVLIHSDLAAIGPLAGLKDRTSILEKWTEILLAATGSRTLLIPSFHYGFPKNLKFDLRTDFGETGVLGNYWSRIRPEWRTQTPVWNFVILRNQGFSLAPALNPFGEESTFAEFARQRGVMFFLGVTSKDNTIFHYFEERARVPYRYLKKLRGKVIDQFGNENPVQFEFRVRPVKPEGAVEYHIYSDPDFFFPRGALHFYPIGKSVSAVMDSQTYGHIIESEFKADPHFFLTPDSKEKVKTAYQNYGLPLSMEIIEGRSEISSPS